MNDTIAVIVGEMRECSQLDCLPPNIQHAFHNFADRLAALGWRPISEAPKDKHIIGWGSKVGRNVCYWDGKQWAKGELSASYQLGPSAITHFHSIPPAPQGEPDE